MVKSWPSLTTVDSWAIDEDCEDEEGEAAKSLEDCFPWPTV